ncbi:hypothetical protein V8F06_006823 [Rhypophila decipiens]
MARTLVGAFIAQLSPASRAYLVPQTGPGDWNWNGTWTWTWNPRQRIATHVETFSPTPSCDIFSSMVMTSEILREMPAGLIRAFGGLHTPGSCSLHELLQALDDACNAFRDASSRGLAIFTSSEPMDSGRIVPCCQTLPSRIGFCAWYRDS